MRDKFINWLLTQAKKDKSILLLTADLGFGVFDNFAKDFPDQFLNVGISEQNMTSMACGLSIEGHKVYTYSIGNFPTLRCFEQIRNDICYHNVDTTIVSVGAGFSYGQLGISHFATEDISVMRSLPGITIISPSNSYELEELLPQLYKINTPKYLRIDKSSANANPISEIQLGRPLPYLQNGNEFCIFATGGILSEAIKTCKNLNLKGFNGSVYSFHTLKPIDELFLREIISSYDVIFSIEEHSLIGGLGSILAEFILKYEINNKKFKSFGIQDSFCDEVGDQLFLRSKYKLDENSIQKEIMKLLEK